MKKLALVIGNNNYELGRLYNPIQDARDIDRVLRKLGFDTDLCLDSDLEEMEVAFKKLLDKRKSFVNQGRKTLCVFYFSGHGCEYRGENYLVPISFNDVDSKLCDLGVNVQYQVKSLESVDPNGSNIIVLDCCRSYPFTRSSRNNSQGLASVTSGSETLIAFAAAPGKTASDGKPGFNSPYTAALKNYLLTPDLSIDDVLKKVTMAVRSGSNNNQIPWSHHCLTTNIILNPSSSAPTYYNRGNVYRELKDYKKAIEDYNKAIDIDPYYADAYYNRGNVYRELKDYKKAIEDYNKAIDIDPNNANTYRNRAQCHWNDGLFIEGARDCYKASLLCEKFQVDYNAMRMRIENFIKGESSVMRLDGE